MNTQQAGAPWSTKTPRSSLVPPQKASNSRTKVRFEVVEAINGNIKILLRRGLGDKNLGYLMLKAQRMAGPQDRIRDSSESSLKCGSLRILVQSRISQS